jgi:hypothetical protein
MSKIIEILFFEKSFSSFSFLQKKNNKLKKRGHQVKKFLFKFYRISIKFYEIIFANSVRSRALNLFLLILKMYFLFFYTSIIFV